MSLSFQFSGSLCPWQRIYNRSKSHLGGSRVKLASDLWFCFNAYASPKLPDCHLNVKGLRAPSHFWSLSRAKKKKRENSFISYKATVVRNAWWCTWIHSMFAGWIGMRIGQYMYQGHIVRYTMEAITGVFSAFLACIHMLFFSLQPLWRSVMKERVNAFLFPRWWGQRIGSSGHGCSHRPLSPPRKELMWWKVEHTQVWSC